MMARCGTGSGAGVAGDLAPGPPTGAPFRPDDAGGCPAVRPAGQPGEPVLLGVELERRAPVAQLGLERRVVVVV
jgi:hypothetical protein